MFIDSEYQTYKSIFKHMKFHIYLLSFGPNFHNHNTICIFAMNPFLHSHHSHLAVLCQVCWSTRGSTTPSRSPFRSGGTRSCTTGSRRWTPTRPSCRSRPQTTSRPTPTSSSGSDRCAAWRRSDSGERSAGFGMRGIPPVG